MTEPQKLAFSLAFDLAKQLITIATGILALTVTFRKDIAGGANKVEKWLKIAWVAYLLSVLSGIWTMMALTGSLMPTPPQAPVLIFEENVRRPAAAQVLFFLAATLSLILYGIRAWPKKSLGSLRKQPPTKDLEGRQPSKRATGAIGADLV
jgi:hypothetical protein